MSGDAGDTIFSGGNVLTVRATSGAEVVFEKVFTYDQLKAMDFRVLITTEP
ncbi:MAG: hypothetical protein HYY03_01345 [Chloroflexi bacterium]|nr:hypothetical protein [Chloroflexota bacterium]